MDPKLVFNPASGTSRNPSLRPARARMARPGWALKMQDLQGRVPGLGTLGLRILDQLQQQSFQWGGLMYSVYRASLQKSALKSYHIPTIPLLQGGGST